MTTATQARAAIRARLEAGNIVDAGSVAVPFRWQNEESDSHGNVQLPGAPSPFVYTEILVSPGRLLTIGGGRGANIYRYPVSVHAYVFVPKGEGLGEAESIAEQIAVLLRSHRGDDIALAAATVQPGGDGADMKPQGRSSDVDNYFWALCEATGYFDQIG